MGRGLSQIAAPSPPPPSATPPSLLPAAGHGAALRALLDRAGGAAVGLRPPCKGRWGGGGGREGEEGGKTKHKGKEEAKHGMEPPWSCAATATQGASGRADIYEINGNLCT